MLRTILQKILLLRICAIVHGQGAEIRCDFDSGDICGWTQATIDEFDWTVHQGTTPSKDTGPDSDHTKENGKGHYIYIEASNRTVQDMAVLTSETVKLTQFKYCLSLWYHMKGSGTGVLAVIANQDIIWSHRYETLGWTKAEIQLSSVKKTRQVQLQIIGVRGGNWKSDIAVDDIDLKRGKCDNPTPEATGPVIIPKPTEKIIATLNEDEPLNPELCKTRYAKKNKQLKKQCKRYYKDKNGGRKGGTDQNPPVKPKMAAIIPPPTPPQTAASSKSTRAVAALDDDSTPKVTLKFAKGVGPSGPKVKPKKKMRRIWKKPGNKSKTKNGKTNTSKTTAGEAATSTSIKPVAMAQTATKPKKRKWRRRRGKRLRRTD